MEDGAGPPRTVTTSIPTNGAPFGLPLGRYAVETTYEVVGSRPREGGGWDILDLHMLEQTVVALPGDQTSWVAQMDQARDE